MVSYSSNRGLVLPTVLGDVGAWAPELNATMGALDKILGGYTTLAGSAYGAAATLSASQAQNANIELFGQPSGDFRLTFASYANGKYSVTNNSTNFWLICQSSIGSSAPTVTVPAGQQMQIFSWGNGITTDGIRTGINVTGLAIPGAVRMNAYVGVRVLPYYFSATDYALFGDPANTGVFTVQMWHGAYSNYSSGLVLEQTFTLNSSTSQQQTGAYTAFYQPGDILAVHVQQTGTNFARMLSVQLNGMRYQGN